MNIAIVGTGYVGLVTGTCLAEMGNHVFCVDINPQKIEKMKQGIIPIFEPQLDEVFNRNIKAQRLQFTTEIEQAMEHCEVIFLALPTPPDEDGSADLSYVLAVAEQIGRLMKSYKVVVNKSTVPVGTVDKVKATIAKYTNLEFDVVSNPEFLREGFAVEDFMKPSRVVIGTQSPRAIEIMTKIYQPFINTGKPLLIMDERSSELTKYAANSFLAAKITFMNEIANFCEIVGADVDKVRLGMGSDDRIGHKFLFPGIGYGGSCFPKDVKALIKSGKEQGFAFEILESTERVNQKQKTILFEAIKTHFQGNLKAKKIALWGLAFKANTDDIREASSLDNIDKLVAEGALVSAYDPAATQNVRDLIGDKIQYCQTMYDAVKDADALLIVTEWSEFTNPDLDKLAILMKQKILFDGRNILRLEDIEGKGFYYKSVGRRTLKN